MADDGASEAVLAKSAKKDKFKGKNAYKGKKQKFDVKKKYGVKVKKKSRDQLEIEELQKQYSEIDPSRIESFTDFPLSRRTLNGLDSAEYKTPTEIQRETIGHALRGHDILGAAKTGSGKTLAFLIPVLELLYRVRWTNIDGLGALIISPTRELAYQTFEVIRSIGGNHDFSAGLVIGGKHLREEARRVTSTNIIICTPGRLLQHMDETVNFNADNLQILILDEADRILDMGFQQTMNGILENLPTNRQTLLFSATQTRSVKDLARLSLKDPMYVSVHEHSKFSTPAKLEQSYITCELHDKLTVLWSFVKSHLKSKTLVFLASCKQVRFVHEVFRRLRPGVTVLALHGAMQQLKRVNMYDQFCRKEFCVMFATDIASRGLDFPEVNWVLQFDCPEDANTYIHRVGRTARYQDDGEAMLMLMPSEEEAMVKELDAKKIPVNKIKVNPQKLWDLRPKLQSLLAADVQLKEFAQRAFVSYVKSVFMMKNKDVFKLSDLDTDEYALSLGLAIPPRIRFLQKEEKRKKQAKKNLELEGDAIIKMFKATAKVTPISRESDSEEEEEGGADIAERTTKERTGSKEEDSGSDEEARESGSGEEESGSDEEAGESGSEEESESHGKKTVSEDVASGSDDEENVSDEEESGSDEEESGSSEDESEESDSDSEEEEILTKKSKNSEKMNFDVGNDDIDDVLTLKATAEEVAEMPVEEEPEDLEAAPKKKEKALTKTKLAKKILKKKLKINTKIMFDDEGKAVGDKLKQPQVALKAEEENYEGGINIEAAKQRMREEDRIDRRTYRERIQKRHMEKKLKEKAKVQKKQQQKMSEEGVAVLDLADDEAGGEDPLAFIPDPDKVYNTSSNKEQQDDQNSDTELGPPKKKMKPWEKKKKKVKKVPSDNREVGDNEESLDTGLSLVDDEALALQLLQS